jgi:exodeoxyribonuclease VIII
MGFSHRSETMNLYSEEIADGIYRDMPAEKYHRLGAVSPSMVKRLIAESAKAMKHDMDNGGHEPTDAMQLGSAVHAAVLEPTAFAERFTAYDGAVRRGKEYDAFCAANAGKNILTKSQWAEAQAMRKAVWEHESSAELLIGGGDAELSMVWTYKQLGLQCRGRCDWLSKARRLVDVKTTRDPKPLAFTRQAYNLLYHVSTAAYCEGLRANGIEVESVHIIAVGSAPPYDVVRYDVADSWLRRGREEWGKALQRVKWCMDHNDWPGFAAEPWPLELPTWAVSEAESDDVAAAHAATEE